MKYVPTMDPAVKDEAIRRLQEEIRKEEEASELAKQKVLEEQRAAEARIHEEFIRLRAEEERVRIEAEKLALQAQAKRLAAEKEAAIQAELERLRNRTPLEVLRDDFKSIVKKLSLLETKPDHTGPISGLEERIFHVSEVNKRLQEQITALSQRNTALSAELAAVKAAKETNEDALLKRITFIEGFVERICRSNNHQGYAMFSNLIPDIIRHKNTQQGVRKFNIYKRLQDSNPMTLKFVAAGIPVIQLRFTPGDNTVYLSHQTTPRPHGNLMSAEKSLDARPFLQHVPGNTSNFNLQMWIYPGKILLKTASGVETHTYIPEGIQLNKNEFFHWSDMTIDLSGLSTASCNEIE